MTDDDRQLVPLAERPGQRRRSEPLPATDRPAVTVSAPSPVLAPLTPEQQLLVDVVAEAFLAEDYEWPFFDYVEGVLDDKQLEALEILQSFPTIGRWSYGAVAWNRNDSERSEVALTVVGMSHSSPLRQYVPIFFSLVDYFASRRREAKPPRRGVRNLTVTSLEFDDYWHAARHPSLPARLSGQLKEHEPPTRLGGRGVNADGSWTAGVARQLLPFEGSQTIEDYVARLEDFLSEPVPALSPILPSLSCFTKVAGFRARMT